MRNCIVLESFFLLIILFFTLLSDAQELYQYKHLNNPCTLLIRPDSVVVRIERSLQNDLYIESVGKIRKVNDSVFHITDTAFFSMSVMENDQDEYSQFGIYVDSSFKYFDDIKILSIRYHDGTTDIVHPVKGGFMKYYFNKARFNRKNKYLSINTRHKDPVTKKTVFIKLFLRDSIEFYSKYITEFDIIISGKKIRILGEPVFSEITRSERT